MIKISLYTQSGEKKSVSFDIAEAYLKLNAKLLAQALYVEEANLSRKSGHAKTKGEVSGGGRKPWKQKGTGRARAGSLRSPIFRGGGVTFGPRAVSKLLVLPKKMKKIAFGQLLIEKARNNEVVLVETFECKDNKTKEASVFLEKIALNGRVMAAFDNKEASFIGAWRNLPLTDCAFLSNTTLRSLVSSRVLVMSEAGAKELFKKFSK